MEIGDICSADFKFAMDKWLLCASYCPLPFWVKGSIAVVLPLFPHYVLGEGRRPFYFYSYIYEAEMLQWKNYTWRNLFSSGLLLDKDISFLNLGLML